MLRWPSMKKGEKSKKEEEKERKKWKNKKNRGEEKSKKGKSFGKEKEKERERWSLRGGPGAGGVPLPPPWRVSAGPCLKPLLQNEQTRLSWIKSEWFSWAASDWAESLAAWKRRSSTPWAWVSVPEPLNLKTLHSVGSYLESWV